MRTLKSRRRLPCRPSKPRSTVFPPREARLRMLAEHSPDIFFSMRFPEGRYEYISPAVEAMFQCTPEDFYADPLTLLRCVAPAWRGQVQAWLEEIAQGQVAPEYEFQVIDKAGRLRWLRQRQVYVPTPDGRAWLLQGLASDITELRDAQQELRESGEHFRQLIEIWPDQVMLSVNLDAGRHEYVSPSMERVMGYAPQEFYDDPGLGMRIVAPQWQALTRVWLAGIKVGEFQPSYEFELVHKNGQHRWIQQLGMLRPQAPGQDKVVHFTFRDITETKQAEAALRLSEERYALALRGASDGIWDWDLVRGEVYYSDRWKEILGYGPEELRHDPQEWTSRIHPQDRERVMLENGRCISGETAVFQVEYRLLHKDGTYRWIFGRGASLQDASGRIVRLAGAHTDITERIRAEEALRKSERLSRMLLESMHEGVWAVDRDQDTIFVNEHLARMLGYSVSELMGMQPLDLLDAQQRQKALERLLERRLGVPGAEDYEVFCKDGSRLPVHVTASPMLDADGGFEGLVCTAVDLSERKHLEEELRRNQARFEALFELSRLTTATEAQMAAFTLREALRLTDSCAGVVFFANEEGTELLPLAWRGAPENARITPFATSGDSPWARVYASREPLVLNDFSLFQAQVPEGHVPVEQFLGVPALDGERVAAILGLTGGGADYTVDDSLQVSLLMDGMWRIVRSRRDEERIRASLREKESLLREVHHRVKNNLQVVSSLLDMAGRRLPEAEARRSMEEVRAKVQAMSLVHAQLHGDTALGAARGHGRGIDLERYVRALFRQLREIYSGGMDLTLRVMLDELVLSLDQAAPLGLALNEILANVFKHGRSEGQPGRVDVRAWREADGRVSIEVRDDGPGLPVGMNPERARSLGLKLMFGLVRDQLGGELSLESGPGGVCVRILFQPHVAT